MVWIYLNKNDNQCFGSLNLSWLHENFMMEVSGWKSLFWWKKNGSKNIWHTKNASSKSYLLGSWKEDICIPYNVQCDMDDGNFLCYLIIFNHV